MSPLLQKLHEEHKDMARLLFALRSQIDSYCQHQSSNVSLILDALDYVSTYPERWHHPFEDVIFKRLLEYPLSPGERTVVNDTLLDHDRLEVVTAELSQAFRNVSYDIAVPISVLQLKAGEYLELQLRHLDIEELEIYPLAMEYLTEDDWDELEDAAEPIEDPLFGDMVRSNYEHLFLAVINQQDSADGIGFVA